MYGKNGLAKAQRTSPSPRLVDRIPYLSLVESLDESDGSNSQATEDARSTHRPTGSKKILIIEDEKGVRELLEDVLYMEGYTPTGIGNGAEGISMFRKHPYDLVVTDLRLPGASGSHVAKTIRDVKPKIPIVIITAWEIEPFTDELDKAGVDCILHKPFNMQQIVSVVNELTRETGPESSA